MPRLLAWVMAGARASSASGTMTETVWVGYIGAFDPQDGPDGGGQAFGVLAFIDMQDECFHLAHLSGQFCLGTQGNQFPVINDADPIG